MPVTRRSGATGSSPASASKAKGKRGADTGSSPASKRSKTTKNDKEQKTIEETMDIDSKDDAAGDTAPAQDEKESNGDTTTQNNDKDDDVKTQNGTKHDQDDKAYHGDGKGKEKNAFDEVKADESEVKKAAKDEETEKSKEITKNNDSVVEDQEREAAMPSSILEKGIIYFFYRGRVNIDEPQGIDDIARSYIVLRPLPLGAKLGEGPLEDSGNARLLALPKKVLPLSKRDRFMVFVEKVNTSIKDLKENFVSGSDYSTKTVGFVAKISGLTSRAKLISGIEQGILPPRLRPPKESTLLLLLVASHTLHITSQFLTHLAKSKKTWD